jgi:hypothetical protein
VNHDVTIRIADEAIVDRWSKALDKAAEANAAEASAAAKEREDAQRVARMWASASITLLFALVITATVAPWIAPAFVVLVGLAGWRTAIAANVADDKLVVISLARGRSNGMEMALRAFATAAGRTRDS